MPILSIAYPVQAAVSVARPLFGFSAVAAMFMMFKPLLLGLLRAAVLVVKPRRSLEERQARRSMKSVLMLNSLVREYDQTAPNLAAELRFIAARDD